MRVLNYFIVSLGLIIVCSAQAASLQKVFQQALNNDPTYKAAEAQWLAGQEDVPIQRAAFLPQFNVSGQLNRVHTDQHQKGPFTSQFANGTVYSNNSQYTLNLSQTVFDYRSWSLLSSAKDTVKQAAAEYAKAAQSLVFRASKAYFEVLKADAVLQADVAERRHLYNELKQTRSRYKVGVDDMVKLDETRSRYENAVAKEIRDRNALATRMEDLRAITGQSYAHLRGLGDNTPLVRPKPQALNQWVKRALQQNFDVQASRYAALAAKDQIHAARGERLPVVKVNGDFNYNSQDNTLSHVPQRTRVTSVGLSVNLPAFQGGRIWSQGQKASYQYEQATDQLDGAYRAAIRDTRQAYLSTISILGNVKADKQTIKAARSALKSSQAAYKAGTRTFVDVLNRLSEFYQAKRQYAQDRYDFIIATLQLKQATGVLSFNDVRLIDSWLKQDFDVRARVLKRAADDHAKQAPKAKQPPSKKPKHAHNS